MLESKYIEDFINRIKKIPGISKKQAEKMVFYFIGADATEVNLLANSIKKIKEQITFCPNCNSASEEGKCLVCEDPQRDNILLVVENTSIVDKIEKAKFYYGKYYVFKYVFKKEIDEEKYKSKIDKLCEFASSFEEVILAISPTLDGEITNNILKMNLKKKGISVSQLAIGLPLGSSLDYIDEVTLKLSLINRKK